MNAIMMAAAMAVAPAPPVPTHEVLPGESLTRIAQCELGDAERWQELVTLNQELITNPDVIVEGWQLVLPQPGTGDCTAPAAVEASTVAPATKVTPRKAKAAPAARSSSGGDLSGIRGCESGGDYGAVSSSGKYRGAYQFDQQTWESVGGSGDPADAAPAEQDQRAATLQQQRGASPWPNCG